MEKDLNKADKKDIAVFGKTKRFGYDDDDDDKPAVIGIKGTTTQLGEQGTQKKTNQAPKLDFPEWDPKLKLSDKSKKITKDIQKTQIELKKTDVEQKEKQLKDLKTQQTKNTDDDSKPAMGDSKPAMGGEEGSGMIDISGIEDVNEQINHSRRKTIKRKCYRGTDSINRFRFFLSTSRWS